MPLCSASQPQGYDVPVASSLQGHGPAEVYLRRDVDAYLAEMHQYIESLQAKVAEAQTTGQATNDNAGLRTSEATLGKALIRAQSVAEQRVKDAHVEAEAILAGARQSAEEFSIQARSAGEAILSAARAEANRVIEESRRSAASVIAEAQAEAQRLARQATLRSEATIRSAPPEADRVPPQAPAAQTSANSLSVREPPPATTVPPPGWSPTQPDPPTPARVASEPPEATAAPSSLPCEPPTGDPVVPVVSQERKSDGKASGSRRSFFKH